MSLNSSKVKQNVSVFSSRLDHMKYKLREAERHNEERAGLIKKYEKFKDLLKKVEVYLMVLENIKHKVIAEDIAFKNRRIDHVTVFIEENLNRIFPYDNFKVKINCNYSRNNNKAYLRLIDSDGNVRIPHIAEGGLNQQIVSFSSSIGITKSFGSNKAYIDEAFSASSPENRPLLGDLIKECVEEGMQDFMIAQSSESYRHINRKEFHLEVDPITKRTVIVREVEY